MHRAVLLSVKLAKRPKRKPSRIAPGCDLKRIAQAAVEWFALHGRDLPWRRTTDPYAILVSELMLQQTTVAAVVGYFERFLAQFPDVRSLAAADEQRVLAQWAGLGYYRRARLLHSAAKMVVLESGGTFPRDLDALQRLPGVGRYTAGAVASFAFDHPAPIVEANTARLMARLFAIEGQLGDPAVGQRLWQSAEALLPASGGRDHNSALMDLGAMICTPVQPRCEECPLEQWCMARDLGLVEEIPAPKVRPEKVSRAFAGAVIEQGGRYLIRRIPQGEWHAGLYEFPKAPVDPGSAPDVSKNTIREFVRSHCGLGTLLPFAELQYVVTRHSVTLTVWRGHGTSKIPASPAQGEKELLEGEFGWMTLAEVSRLPLGSAQRRLLDLLANPNDLFGNPNE